MLFAFSTLTLAIVASVQALPLEKRIQQNIPDSLTAWEQACLRAGGGQACNPAKVAAFTNLLAAAGPCAQQDSADTLIDLAHQHGNDPEMIRLTQIFAQQPRNSPNKLSVPYCQTAPKNDELKGLFQCQFEGVDDTTFSDPATGNGTGDVKVGQPGTIPLGQSSPLSPPGSCKANPGGKVPDGQQLVDIIGSGSSGADNTGNTDNNSATDETPAQTATSTNDGSSDSTAAPESTSTPATDAPTTDTDAPATTSATTPASTASGFQVDNAQKAQQQNKDFATLTADSSCSAGDNACVNGEFSQCVGGKFVSTGCAGGTQCMALPLVNSPGTSITCTTLDDAARRFSAISGGFDGQH